MKLVLAHTTEVCSRTLVQAGASSINTHEKYLNDYIKLISQSSLVLLLVEGKGSISVLNSFV
jgi:hypothetical protein